MSKAQSNNTSPQQGPRPEFVDGTGIARRAVITPAETHGIDADLRRALAARISNLTGQKRLAASYRAEMTGPDWLAIADGAEAHTVTDAAVTAVVRHADHVTIDPAASTGAHIAALEEAGLSAPQIVAVSELIAFVNYHARVEAGLSLMEAEA